MLWVIEVSDQKSSQVYFKAETFDVYVLYFEVPIPQPSCQDRGEYLNSQKGSNSLKMY